MKIGLFLTSSMSVGQEYIDLTRLMGQRLARENFGIVYGGTDYGMMKELAVSYKEAGGSDLAGIMSKELESVTKNYKAFEHLDQSFWEDRIIDRVRKINDLADGFVFLPGGYGALEEMMSIIGGKANKLHDKPIVLYNYDNFYDKLLEFWREMHNKQFSKIAIEEIVYVCCQPDDVINYLKTYSPKVLADKFV